MSDIEGGCACGKVRFKITQGEAKVHTLKVDSGGDVGRAFRRDCGTPLWSMPGSEAPFFSVKLGALDDSSGFAPS